jgi:Nuclease-related domain
MVFMELPTMASWKQRFDAWHKISKTDLSPVEEDGWVLAGRDAEDLLHKLVEENYSFQGCHSFAGKRVPNLDGKGRREIDLIVVTAKRLYIIECKNWTGYLIAEGDRWVQTTERNGQLSRKDHENVLEVNRLKMRLLLANLRNQGIVVKPGAVCQKVIFMNPKLQIRSPKIAESADVITPDRLETYLNSQNAKLKFHERLFSAVIGVLLDDETKGKILDGVGIELVGGEKHERLVQAIRELGTWDKIFVHGTKILSGDIWRNSPVNIFTNHQSLEGVKTIQVRFTKSKWLGFFQALLKIGRPISLDLYDAKGKLITKVDGNPDGVISIAEAGSKEATDVSICQIDRLIYGRYLDPNVPQPKTSKRRPKSRSSRQGYPRKAGSKLLPLAIAGSILVLTIPAIRNPLFSAIGGWNQPKQAGKTSIDPYVGEYDFGKYAVKVYSQDNKLWADTAAGKAELKQSSNPMEFKVISSRQGSLGKYIFPRDKQGKIAHLLWIQSNGQQRKCPRVG